MAKSYPKYKPSNIPWIGEIPDHWEVSRIKYISNGEYKSFVDGDWIEAENITSYGIRLIQTGNIGIGEYIEQGFRYITEDTFRKLHCTEIHPNDVLICRLAEPVGRACLAPYLKERMITAVDNCILKPSSNYHSKFIVYFLSSIHYLDYLETLARGGTRQRISRSMLGDLNFIFPSYEEQQQIATYLDNKTQKIDKLISNKQKQIELLKEERQAIINNAVSGRTIASRVRGGIGVADGLGSGIGVDDERGAVHGVGREKDVGGGNVANATAAIAAAAKAAAEAATKTVKYKPSGIPWLGDIPEHWEVKKLKYVIKVKSGESIVAEELIDNGTYEAFGGNGFIGNTNKFNIQGDTIIIGRVGAKCGNVRYSNERKWISDNALIVKTNQNYEFMALLLESVDLNKLSIQNAQPLITSTIIKELVVPIPPTIDEQVFIVLFIKKEISHVDYTISIIEKEISLLQEYRTALISEVVTGKIDVREELVS